jgi:hypothetical protein
VVGAPIAWIWICTSLLISFAHFKIGSLVFVYIFSSLYTLDINPFSDE